MMGKKKIYCEPKIIFSRNQSYKKKNTFDILKCDVTYFFQTVKFYSFMPVFVSSQNESRDTITVAVELLCETQNTFFLDWASLDLRPSRWGSNPRRLCHQLASDSAKWQNLSEDTAAEFPTILWSRKCLYIWQKIVVYPEFDQVTWSNFKEM